MAVVRRPFISGRTGYAAACLKRRAIPRARHVAGFAINLDRRATGPTCAMVRPCYAVRHVTIRTGPTWASGSSMRDRGRLPFLEMIECA
jgi:hypothetical protein